MHEADLRHSNVSNMVFIDHPATVGLSYSIPINAYTGIGGSIIALPDDNCPEWAKGCATYSDQSPAYVPNSTIGAAPSFWKTIQGFTGAFPQYSSNGFNFASESYGGHYGPVFNESVAPYS